MNKLKLAIDDLTVESFEISEAREKRGTVLGACVIEPASEAPCADQTAITGPCCALSREISCAQTGCFEECNSLDADVCFG